MDERNDVVSLTSFQKNLSGRNWLLEYASYEQLQEALDRFKLQNDKTFDSTIAEIAAAFAIHVIN